MPLALDGLKVIDLGRSPMTIYCSMILGDLGADVIWIQDTTRPNGSDEDLAKRAAFDARLRNKRSLALDLKQDSAQEVMRRLIRRTDVMLEGFRPGVTQRLGVDYETLKPLNPRLVYCSVSGFGQTGPYRDYPGHDNSYSSISGAMSLIGEADRKPVPAYNLLADNASGGLLSCISVLTALLWRETSGQGQYIDLSMTDGVASLMGHVYSEYFRTGQAPHRGEAPSSGGLPQYSIYETADGKFISIAALEQKFLENLCHLLGRPDFIGNLREQVKRDEMRAFLQETFLQKSRDEWFDILAAAEVPAGKVNSPDEATEDPHLLARDVFIELADEKVGPVRQIGMPFKMSETPGEVRRLGPRKGAHTAEILRSLDYEESEIEAMKQSGAILVTPHS